MATMRRSSRAQGYTDLYSSERDASLVQSSRLIWLFFIVVLLGLAWSYFAKLDEVATGSGRVIPSMRDQIIQSLEGGIVAEMHVRENQIVESGDILAKLDPTMTRSNVEESEGRYRAAIASIARLQAEVDGSPLSFPDELKDQPALIAEETELYNSRRRRLDDSLQWTTQSKELVESELSINEGLTDRGAASKVEVFRLRRQLAELELNLLETQSSYMVEAREALSKAKAEADSLRAIVEGRADSLTRLTFRSPVRGIVKNIEVSTIGGVIAPNGKLMDIVPLGEQLVIETQISPKDIAYVHEGQRATVKLTAYDYAIFGALKGKVSSISPDTIRDEVKPEIYYYRVFVQTEEDAVVNKLGQRFQISPGMVATVDVHTGSKTVWEYLTKPLNRAAEALRER
jgi:adhesin transport system membrane fusion protein